VANKGFNFVVRGRNFTVLSNESVKLVKMACEGVFAKGFRIIYENRAGKKDKVVGYVFQSTNVHDILNCIRSGGWANSSSADVKEGMKVYIVPNMPEEELYGVGAIGVVFDATEDMYEDINNTFTWSV